MQTKGPWGLLQRLNRRIGNRGSVLLLFGSINLVYAHALLFPTGAARINPTYLFVSHVMPLWVWATLWGTAGLLCWAQAFAVRDRLAFSAATALYVLFGLTCLGGWAVGAIERGHVSAGIWLGLAGLIARIATWPEPAGYKGS